MMRTGNDTVVIVGLATLRLYGIARKHSSFEAPRWLHKRLWSKAKVVDPTDLAQFAKYNVQNGWLLDMKESDFIGFTVAAALTYAHPLARKAIAGRKSSSFPNVRSLNWIERKMHPQVEPDGTIGYSSMDSLTDERDKSHLGESWGDVEILSDRVEVREIHES